MALDSFLEAQRRPTGPSRVFEFQPLENLDVQARGIGEIQVEIIFVAPANPYAPRRELDGYFALGADLDSEPEEVRLDSGVPRSRAIGASGRHGARS
jgi:hypothetical protein